MKFLPHVKNPLSAALVLGMVALFDTASATAQSVHAIVTVQPDARAHEVASLLLKQQRDGEISNLVWVARSEPSAGEKASPMAILDFRNQASYTRWLTRQSLRLRDSIGVVPAERVASQGQSGHDGVVQVVVSQPTVSENRYKEYVGGYTVPLMDIQRDSGLMNDYAVYLERDSQGRLGRAIRVAGYPSVESLKQAMAVKEQAKASASDEGQRYREWSNVQPSIRKDVSESFASFVSFDNIQR